MNIIYMESKKVIHWRGKYLSLVIVAIFLLFPIPVLSGDQGVNREITINWTDTGAYFMKRPEHLKRPDKFMFGTFSEQIQGVFPEVSPKGQILIPMPENEDLPKTEAEWQAFTSKLYEGIKERIEKALEDGEGIDNFEIRTVQNITDKIPGGYWTPWQQRRCVTFTKAFLEALAKVKNDLLKDYQIKVNGVVGSNGGYVATGAIPDLKQNPLDKLIIVDGRAYVNRTIETAYAMNGNLILINTGGDAPAFIHMIANHEGAKLVKLAVPEVEVVYVDLKGWNVPWNIPKAHISVMRPSTEMDAKRLIGYFDGYTAKKKMRAIELLEILLAAPRKELNVSDLDKKIIVESEAAELLLETSSTMEEVINHFLDEEDQDETIGNIKALHDFVIALQKDIEMSKEGKFTVLRSHTLEQVGRFGLGKMPDLVDFLKKKEILPSSFKLPPTFGAEEFVTAIARHIGSGRADIDTITHYLDGLNMACWGVLGYITGGPEAAKLYQSIANTGAKLLRAATLPIFNKAVLVWRRQGQDLANQWYILQERRIYDGLTVQKISEVYTEELLRKNGISKRDIQRLDAIAHDLNQKLIRMKRDFSIEKIEAFKQSGELNLGGVSIDPDLLSASFYRVPSYWTSASRPQSLTEAQTITEIIPDKKRVLIVGKGPEANLMYENMVAKLGKENIKRIYNYTGYIELQLEAKTFGADVILGVKELDVIDEVDDNIMINRLARGDWMGVREEIRMSSANSVARWICGYAALYMGDYRVATDRFSSLGDAQTLERLLEWANMFAHQYPESVVAQMLKGDALARSRKYEEALAALNEAAKLNPRSALVYDVRGVVNAFLGEFEKASADFTKAVKCQQNFADAYVNRGIVKFWGGDMDGAMVDLNKSIELAPDFALAYNSRGQLAFSLEEWDAAVADFETAGKLAPGVGWIQSNIKLALWARAQAGLSHQVTLMGSRGTTIHAQTLVIDGAGVNSQGATPRQAWAREFLDTEYAQINVRHEGSPLWVGRKWPTAEQNVIYLPRQWDPATADRKIKPLLENAWQEGKSVYLNIDVNLTLPGYLAGKTKELEWAARVADYAIQKTPKGTYKVFSGHSAFTDVPKYMSEKADINNWVLQSPRNFYHMKDLIRAANPTAHFDLITGEGDAPHLGPNLHRLGKENNVRVIELLKPGIATPFDWPPVHSQVGRPTTTGNLKITTPEGTTITQGRLGSLVSEPINATRPQCFSLTDSQIPNYWVSPNSPLPEASALASMVNTGSRMPLPGETSPTNRHVLVAGTGQHADLMVQEFSNSGWRVTRMPRYNDYNDVQAYAEQVDATRIVGTMSGEFSPLVPPPTPVSYDDGIRKVLGLNTVSLPLSGDDWKKYRIPPSLRPDTVGKAEMSGMNFRVSPTALPMSKPGGVAQAVTKMKISEPGDKADMSGMFGGDESDQPSASNKQEVLLCPFLLFCDLAAGD